MTSPDEVSVRKPPPENSLLRDVAIACFMFNSLTRYNRSLRALRKETGPAIDLGHSKHRDSLIKWLNEWGCRHLAKNQHATASQSILQWYESDDFKSLSALKPLWMVSDHELEGVCRAYDGLARLIGAHGTREGKDRPITIGPTAASKVLFALRPEALAPWDDKMRTRLGYSDGAEGYLEFLEMVRARARSLAAQCRDHGFDISELPQKLGREEHCTVVALLNEHMWVTVSAGVTLPSQDDLTRWAGW